MERIDKETAQKLDIPSISSKFTSALRTGIYTGAERVHFDELGKDAYRLAQPAIEELQKMLSDAIAEGARDGIYEALDEILKEQKP